MLFEVVKRKSATAGSLDGWGWRELKVLPVAWFDGLARILSKVEDLGVWPDGLLDAYIAMIPKVDGDATPLGQRPLSALPVVYRVWASARMLQLEPWFRSWVPSCVFSAGGGRSSVEAWFTTALDIEEVLSGIVQGDVHVFVADVIKSFDTVDRGILDRVLSSLGLPGWFRHAYFEYHSSVRLRFKLAAGLGQPWTRDGGILQGCPLSMMFIVALYLPWCRYLAAQPQLKADLLLRAARFTTGYVRLVGQELAPRKCVEGCSGHGPAHLLVESAAEIGFSWCSQVSGWNGPGLPVLSMMAGPIQHFSAAVFGAWRLKVSVDLCSRKGFRGGPFLDVSGTVQLLNSDHVRERDKALLRGVLVGGVWNGFLLGKVKGCHVPCRFCGGDDGDGHLFWDCTFPPLVEIRENPEFHELMEMDKSFWPRCLLWHGWLPMLSGVNRGSPWAVESC